MQDRAAPPYVVLCAFRRFEVWEPGRFPSAPRAGFILDELPENYEKLLFLTGTDQEPLFGASYKELTTEAAQVVAELYQKLLERKAAAPETLRSFVLQIVWCLIKFTERQAVRMAADQRVCVAHMSATLRATTAARERRPANGNARQVAVPLLSGLLPPVSDLVIW